MWWTQQVLTWIDTRSRLILRCFSYCMQQKFLLKIRMTDDKTRAKAMRTAVQLQGNIDSNTRDPDFHNFC